jgi:hypothetical protein
VNRFNPSRRKVLDESLSTDDRKLALRWCIRQYCRLTSDTMEWTYGRLNKAVGVPLQWEAESTPTHDQLVQAVNILTLERDRFLKALQEFESMRRMEKSIGNRVPQAARGSIRRWYATDN